jgi:hypothetical protein
VKLSHFVTIFVFVAGIATGTIVLRALFDDRIKLACIATGDDNEGHSGEIKSAASLFPSMDHEACV